MVISLAICAFLFRLQTRHASFSVQVFTGLGRGVILGAVLHLIYGVDSAVIMATNAYINIAGSGYVKLLQMPVMPLILMSIIGAILKIKGAASLGKFSALTIGMLMLTTMVATMVGILMAIVWFDCRRPQRQRSEVARGEVLQATLAGAKAVTLHSMVLRFIPSNPFLDMTGARKTSTIAMVIFSVLVGLSATGTALAKPLIFASIENFANVAHAIIMRLFKMVLRLTPYGVFALIARVVAEISCADVLKLFSFVLAYYSSLLLVFGVHLALIMGVGLDPIPYVRKIFPVLAFAFTSAHRAPVSAQYL